MMIGPSTITRLIQITGRTEVAQTVSEIDFIARLQPDNPNTPVQPRQQRIDQNTPQGKTPEHRPRAEQDTIVGRQASAQTNPTNRSSVCTATLGACGYVAIPDKATRFDAASDDARPDATNTAGDRICAKGNQWTDGRTVHSISRNRCYCHCDCDGGWSTDTPHNARGCCAGPNTIRPANGKSTKRRRPPSCPEHHRNWSGGWPHRWNRDWRKRGDDPTARCNNCDQSAATDAANHGTQRHTNHTRPNSAAYPADASGYIAHGPNDAKRKRGCCADTKRVNRSTHANNRSDCTDTNCAPNQ